MDSEDYIPLEVEGKTYEVIDEVTDSQFELEGEQYEVIDEVRDTQLESEDGLTKEGVTMRREAHPEIQPFITEKLKTEPGGFEESTEQAKDAGEVIGSVPNNEEANVTKPPPRSEPPSEQVVGVEIKSEENRNVPKVSDAEEIPGDLNRSNEKRVDDQSSAAQTEVENKQVNSVQNVTDSQIVPENSEKVDEKKESLKSKSVKAVMQSPPLKQSIFQDSNVLLIGGMFPGHSGELKHLLNTSLGVGSHRIKPRQKGDSFLRVEFRSKDEMGIARNLLHEQIFMGRKLTAEVDTCQPTKRKAEKVDDATKPPVKKRKEDPLVAQWSNTRYRAQIAKKTKDVHLKLRQLAKLLGSNFPRYRGLIEHRELKNGGFFCPLGKFRECPFNKRFGSRCKFAIGIGRDTGQLAVGFRAGSGYVNRVSSVKHSVPPHVVEAVQVFEKAIHVFEKAWEDSEVKHQFKFWHDLVIRTNLGHDLMFLVFVDGPQDLAPGRIKRLNKELKEFFENGEGKKCGVTSVFTKVMHKSSLDPEHQKPVMGSPYLEETVAGLKFRLSPTVKFWNNIHAAKMVCKGVEELLAPTKRISLVEIGFGLGLVGLHLSRVAGEVLSVVSEQSVEEAQKNAARNKISNCQYFDGSPEEVLPQIARKIIFEKACVVIICGAGRNTTSTFTMEAIRKIERVRRLVIVTEMFKSRFSTIAALCNPSRENGMGNPFFPVRAVPVDTMPNADGYALMILMERMGLLCLPKLLGLPESDPALRCTEKGPDSHRVADIIMPYKKVAKETRLGQGDARLTIISRREGRELLQHREEKKSFKAYGRHRFAGRECLAGEDFKRPYCDDESSALEEYDIRELKAEERRSWIEEEEHTGQMEDERMTQIEEEKQRRWVEEDERGILGEEEEHRNWIEEKEHLRQMEEKEFKRLTEEKELKRQMEEKEFKRQMEEKEFKRQMEETEFRRHVEEEEFRRLMEEKEFKRQMEEKESKRWVEEERKREMVRRTSVNLRSRNDMVQDLIADSLREASIPQLSEETAQKLKQLIAEAVRSVGAVDQEERRVASTSRGVGAIHSEDITISRFGRPDKEMTKLRHFEEGYPCHIKSERDEDKLMPQSGRFEEGYSRPIREVNSLYQHGYNAYEGAVGKDSYQHDLKPQHSVYSMKEVPVGHITVDRAGSQPLKLNSSGGCGNSAPHLEGGGDSYMRHVYHSGVSPTQRQEQSFGQSVDSYTRHSHFSGDHGRNERHPSLHSSVKQNTDSYVRLRAPSWSSSNATANYIPLSNTRKHTACSTPKPPGTEDVNHLERSNYIYEDSASWATNSWQSGNASYQVLETKYSSKDYRNRMQDGQGQDRTQHTRYFM